MPATNWARKQQQRRGSHGPSHESQFSQALSITSVWVADWGVPRRRDNDDLWQGVLADNDSEFEASGGFPQVAARVFDEQDEFFHFFEMVMIFYFHNGRTFNKGSNGGWSIHLEKKMIFILIIMLTIKVKITKDLRWRGIYWVSMTDYILKIFLIGFILTKTFLTIWIFQKKIK